jgi:iron complex outermembrane receptor protein
LVRTYAFSSARLLRQRGWLPVLLSAGLSPAFAQTQPADTARRVLPTVQVQALRPTRYAAGSRITSLDSVALAPYQTGTVADALAARTPLYIKNYGPGQLASISIRGTSARHTAVLWHGFNLNFPTLGEADFALLPTAAIGRIDVQHGPAAALYGTGAVGGAVVLGDAPVRAGSQVSGLFEAGSFGARTGSFQGSHRDERVSLRTSFSQRTARNDFEYLSPEFGGPVRRRQENAALSQSSFSQDISVQLTARDQLQGALWVTAADRQIQPAIGSANRQAREKDQSARALLGYEHQHAHGTTAVRAAWFADVIDYGDQGMATSHSRTQTRQTQAEHVWQARPNLSLRLGAEAQQLTAHVDGYRRYVQEWRFAGFGLLRYDPTPRLRLTLNARQAALPHRRPPLAPTLGAEWQLWRTAGQQLWLKGNVARTYRAPTLNERYWPTGNPELLPETGLGYEAGLHHEARWGHLSAETDLTAYQLTVDDWVQWIPNAAGQWTPRNLRQVRSQGLEVSSQLGWTRGAYRLNGRLSYAFTQARKRRGYIIDEDPSGVQLPYVPLHAGNVALDQSWRGWTLTGSLALTGYRYTDASATTFLPGYALVNASAGRSFRLPGWTLTALVQGYNLANTSYQNYAFRAMPLRSGALSLRVSWHQ